MSLQRWPLSQEANKSKGTCSVCNETHQLHLRGNTVHQHGPRAARCSGSNKPPLSPRFASQVGSSVATSPVPQLDNASFSQPPSVTPSNPTLSFAAAYVNTTSTQNKGFPLLSANHPVLKCPIIKHIPKSARPACCSALAEILTSIQRNKSDHSAWVKLFEFCPSILCIPPKSGSTTSVSSIIKDRLTGCSSASSAGSHHTSLCRKQKGSALAAAVTSKAQR